MQAMDKLIGRKQEIKLLKEYTSSDRPEFVAIYGRRRVGKTFLVNQLFDGKLAFSMTGVLNGTKEDCHCVGTLKSAFRFDPRRAEQGSGQRDEWLAEQEIGRPCQLRHHPQICGAG